MVELKKVTSDDVYETIHQFVTSGELVVDDYDSMIEVILSMIKVGYCFVMDRDLLRDTMESLTYMYAPSDDMNKDRLVQQFADDEEEDDDEEDGEEDFGNMDLMKMMQMMGGAMGGAMGGEGGMPDLGSLAGDSKAESPEPEPKTVTTDEVPSEVEETTVVKEDETVPEEPTTEAPATEAPATEAPKPVEEGGAE